MPQLGCPQPAAWPPARRLRVAGSARTTIEPRQTHPSTSPGSLGHPQRLDDGAGGGPRARTSRARSDGSGSKTRRPTSASRRGTGVRSGSSARLMNSPFWSRARGTPMSSPRAFVRSSSSTTTPSDSSSPRSPDAPGAQVAAALGAAAGSARSGTRQGTGTGSTSWWRSQRRATVGSRDRLTLKAGFDPRSRPWLMVVLADLFRRTLDCTIRLTGFGAP
jgi:hypothetical protein